MALRGCERWGAFTVERFSPRRNLPGHCEVSDLEHMRFAREEDVFKL